MAVREIKTTIALDGEKEFKRAMEDAQREMRLMGAELKQVASEFDLAGDQQEYYTRRSGVLRNQIQQQKNIVAAYEKAVGDMAKKHGEASREVQDMSISLTTAQTKLNKLQKELDDNEKAAKDFGKAVEKNVEKEAKDAGKAVDSLGDELSGLDGKLGGIEGALDGLRTLTGIDLGMDLFGQVPDWVNQVLEWGSEGREYARGQARFEQVAEWAGIDPEEANAQLDRAAAIFGDREETRTGIQQLLNIKGLKSEDLPVILDNLIGAALANSDLSFEGITSDFQESVSSGELSGQFAEMLSRGGMTATDIEAVKTELESGKTQRERLITLLTALSKIEYEDKETGEKRGYVDFLREYQTENAGIIEAENVSQQKQEAWGELKASEPVQAFSLGADLVTLSLTDVLSEAVTGENPETAKKASPAYRYWGEHEPQNWYEQWAIANGQVPRIGYSPGAVPQKKNLGITLGQMFGTRNEWGELWSDYTQRTGISRKEATLDLYGTYSSQTRQEEPRRPLSEILADPVTRKPFYNSQILNYAATMGLEEAAKQIETNYGDVMQQLGIDLGSDLGAGITEGGKGAIQAMQDVVDGINTAAAGIVVPQVSFPTSASAGGGYAGGGTGGNVYLDGRRVGQIMTPTINGMMGRQS